MNLSSGPRNPAVVLGMGAAVAAGATLTFYAINQLRKRLPKWHGQFELLQEYAEIMLPPRDSAKKLESDIVDQMQKGLAKTNGSSIAMLPTYVLSIPDGTETGSCFAIDMGGTNFRVLFVRLGNGPSEVAETDMESINIPKEVYTGTADQLFDFLASRLAAFMIKHESKLKPGKWGEKPVVGFGFSFPATQDALNHGVLTQWTKGFDVRGVVGKDVVKMLSDALAKAGHPCRVTALVNDTVAVLAASCYTDPDTTMGVILGTGTNAAIITQSGQVKKWTTPAGTLPTTRTMINTEWGGFASPLLPRCQEDADLDKASGPQKGQQLMEKLMSGLYLGEAARRILLTFAQRVELFGPQVPAKLAQHGTLTTAQLSEIESDASFTRWRVAKVLQDAFLVQPNTLPIEALAIVQEVCRLVVRRSARVCATLLSAVLHLQEWYDNPTRITIAADGGVILNYPNWRGYHEQYLREAIGGSNPASTNKLMSLISIKPVQDGSSFGAAVLAAAAATPR